MDYQTRIQVYRHTQQFANVYYPNIATSTKYSDDDLKINIKKGTRPEVVVVNDDTLDQYVALIKEGFKPVLLNMASNTTPGGGVTRGCATQEENLFRRTNYFMTLDNTFYPIEGVDTIYSKNVVLFKANEETGYALIEKPIRIAVIASPSVKHPALNQNGEFRNKEDHDLEYYKIRMIFKAAIANGHDSMLLSAYGCGAYRAPPYQVAQLFKRVIDEYGAYFKKIVFAIKQPPGDDRDNYGAFASVLKW
jgi:uncharacterized protein (TIGR02452 family)